MLPTTKNDKPKELKVTDKRIFTPEGDIREEFRKDIRPVEPSFKKMEEPAAAPAAEKPAPKPEQLPVEERDRKSVV